eukprot:GSChrysophyteH1.ASY1.ANO1.1322.1 assembled CDS
MIPEVDVDELTSGEGQYAASRSPLLISTLQDRGNQCNDWSRVYFRDEIEGIDSAKFIKDCSFNVDGPDGGIFIGRFTDQLRVNTGDGTSLPNGLLRSNFFGKCYLHDGCRVSDTPIIQNIALHSGPRAGSVDVIGGAAIISCAKVICTGYHSGGYDTELDIGAENGGRRICLGKGRTYGQYCQAALTVNLTPNILELYSYTHIGAGCCLSGGATIINCILEPRTVVNQASLTAVTLESRDWNVEAGASTTDMMEMDTADSLTSAASVMHGSVLTNCVLNPGSSVGPSCHVKCTYLGEFARITDGALVCSSIIGPDASVGRGECHHSILGPFTGFHHASLLISALWPLGRGNLGYGAMLGSNHTGRVNDQEFFPGEGCFFGLGSSVKFPCNLLGSPYSLLATNTSLPPGLYKYPFSLMAPSRDQLGYAIRPGWVLYNNPYMIERSMKKYASRRKALETRTDFDIFRVSTIDSVRGARSRLRRQVQKGDLPAGVESVERGIKAYDDIIKRYCLHGLLVLHQMDPKMRETVNVWLRNNSDLVKLRDEYTIENRYLSLSPNIQTFRETGSSGFLADIASLDQEDADNANEPILFPSYALTTGLPNLCHQWAVLLDEYVQELEPCVGLLKSLPALERKFSDAVFESKLRDDDRGVSTIPNYALVNDSMRQFHQNGGGGDSVIIGARDRAIAVEDVLRDVLGDDYPY